jgi:HK97 gp10 family phage protein
MADDITIQVEGLSELRRSLKRLSKEAPKQLREANLAAAEIIIASALPNVPVRTGRLKRTVKALATQTASRMKAGSGTVPYAAAVHWGTGPRPGERGPHNIRRRAFLWDAREKLLREVRDQYEKELEALIDRAVR